MEGMSSTPNSRASHTGSDRGLPVPTAERLQQPPTDAVVENGTCSHPQLSRGKEQRWIWPWRGRASSAGRDGISRVAAMAPKRRLSSDAIHAPSRSREGGKCRVEDRSEWASIRASISSNLGNCTSLEKLDLSNNQFTGPIPDTLGDLANLISFSLVGSQLNRTINVGVCRRWRLLCSSVDALDFASFRLFQKRMDKAINASCLEAIVSQMLLKSNGVRQLSVSYHPVVWPWIPDDHFIEDKVCSWLNHVQGSLIKLVLVDPNRDKPQPRKLVQLSLCTKLTWLNICYVLDLIFINDTALQTIVQLCPRLEELKINSCKGLRTPTLASPNLASLEFVYEMDVCNTSIACLTLDAPKLSKMTLSYVEELITDGESLLELGLLCHVRPRIRDLSQLTVLQLKGEVTLRHVLCAAELGQDCAGYRVRECIEPVLHGQHMVPTPTPEADSPLLPALLKCTWLQVIDLAFNLLSGHLPEELASLEKLLSFSNMLTGNVPAWIGRWQKVDSVLLSTNSFTGRLPLEIGNCSSLRDFGVDANLLSGATPPEICGAKSLSQLTLNRNMFIVGIFSKCTSRTQLDLTSNNFSGSLPADLLALPLMSLDLSGYNFSGKLLDELWKSSVLMEIYASNTNFEGELPSWIGNLQSLQHLFLDNNMLSGWLPREIGCLTNLTRLDLSQNQLTGTVPAELGDCHKLQGLNLANNQLSGSIPREIGQLRNLVELNLTSNALSGAIPDSIGNMTVLYQLDLSDNSLKGELPRSMANLPLVGLFLQNNMLTGSIDGLFTDTLAWHQLQVLDLSYNSFKGAIPGSIGILSAILIFKGNHYTGSTPAELANLFPLAYADMSDNELSGRLPEKLCDFFVLSFLNVSNNRLAGPIPKRCSDFFLQSFVMSKTLCGSFLHSACPPPSRAASEFSVSAVLGITLGSVLAVFSFIFALSRCRNSRQEAFTKMTEEAKLTGALDPTLPSMSKMKEPLSISVALFERPLLLRLTFADILQATGCPGGRKDSCCQEARAGEESGRPGVPRRDGNSWQSEAQEPGPTARILLVW